jgi:hypothetical protein
VCSSDLDETREKDLFDLAFEEMGSYKMKSLEKSIGKQSMIYPLGKDKYASKEKVMFKSREEGVLSQEQRKEKTWRARQQVLSQEQRKEKTRQQHRPSQREEKTRQQHQTSQPAKVLALCLEHQQ